MRTKNMLLGVCVLLLVAGALWWSVDRRSDSDVSLFPFRREVEEVRKEGGRGGYRDANKDEYKDLQRSIFANFRDVADFLNKNAPSPAGESLLLKGAEASEDGPSMTYTYVVDGEMAIGMRNMEPVMRAVCGAPEMRDYMQYGVFYRYVYENKAGKVLMSFRVDDQTCTSLELASPEQAPDSSSRNAPVPATAPLEIMTVLPVLPENMPDRAAMDMGVVPQKRKAVGQEPSAAHGAHPAGERPVPGARSVTGEADG